MNKEFDILKNIRLTILDLTRDLSLEELNQIPEGFNNNIIWNMGHLVSTISAICYLRSGNEIKIDERIFKHYRKGTKPEKPVDTVELALIKDLMVCTIDELEEDYNNGLFTQYDEWTTSYGVTLSSVDDAIRFAPFHEGLHMGAIKAQMKLIAPKEKV